MHIADCTTPVLVLRLDHYGQLGIMRSLGRLGVPVWGVHKSADALALRSKYCRGGYEWDIDAARPEHTVEFLRSVARQLGQRPLLVPSNDETALFVADHAAPLREHFRFQENPPELVRSLYDKKAMYYLARKFEIPTAETVFPRSREEVLAIAATLMYPVMLKGSDGIRLSQRTGEKMLIVRSPEELIAEYNRMEDPRRPDLMIQEYIPGGEDAQWMFNGYFDDDSRCLFGLVGRKLRQTPPYTGMTSLGVVVENPVVEAMTRSFMKAIGYRGILDIGWRYDARDRKYKVLDINPRIGATFRLFVGTGGLDVIRAQYLHQTGQEVPPSEPKLGRRWFVEDLDFLSSVRYWTDGVLSMPRYARSFAGVRESAWFAADDPQPFVGKCADIAQKAASKLEKAVFPRTVKRQLDAAQHRAEVRELFTDTSLEWKRIDESPQLEPTIYRDRRRTAIKWVTELGLPPSARVLDLGCGAGQTSLELASRGFEVHALDAAPEMVRITSEAARAAGLRSISARVGDAHELELPSNAFDLVVALGLLPWLHSATRGLQEMARVLKPGGYLIATADNVTGLHRVLDPRATPLLAPARSVLKRVLGREAEPAICVRHAPAEVDELIARAGLRKVQAATVGFGPFSFGGRPILDDPASVAVHRTLQRLADGDWPLFASSGKHYLVLAQKPVG
jgi:predicted ATP-grasp superfamily ATP-dependent carboligase/ubiquinone/menaquinone biosynthesis C-methylase UbiE